MLFCNLTISLKNNVSSIHEITNEVKRCFNFKSKISHVMLLVVYSLVQHVTIKVIDKGEPPSFRKSHLSSLDCYSRYNLPLNMT
jgi:hypothetical protein